MPDFIPPFGQNGERRLPNANEQSLGWPCGPIDQALLNGLFHLHNGNIANVITEAGITGPDGDLTKLRRAIEALIAAATGGGTASDFVIMTQARARLPIFPDVDTADGRIGVTAPSTGTVRLAGGVEFLHRGIFRVTTVQTDFATDPSKTYHLRWNPTDGFVLRDLASGTYNPGTLSEANVAFDSAFDDMLIARVVTNSSNVATITTLANRDRLETEQEASGPAAVTSFNPAWGGRFSNTFSLNWSRTPRAVVTGTSEQVSDTIYPDGWANRVEIQTQSRYQVAASVETNWTAPGPIGANGRLRLVAFR